MLTSLRVQNFKAWEDLRPGRLAPITGFFGANSAGKTSLLQFLLLLKQTAESADRSEVLHFGTDRDAVRLGSLRELLHRHELTRQLQFELAWQQPEPLRLTDPQHPSERLADSDQLIFQAAIAALPSGAPAVERFRYGVGPFAVGMLRQQASPDSPQYDLEVSPALSQPRRRPGRPTHLPAPNRFYGFPDQVLASYQNVAFLADLELALQALLQRIHYLGPLREQPQREYRWSGSTPRDVGPRGERAIEALLSAQERGLQVQPGRRRHYVPLLHYVARKLVELQVVATCEVTPIAPGSDLYRVWVQVTRHSPRVLLTDVGFGVSQVLPVVTLLYYAPVGSIILLEQPEIHLHPRVQAGLADILIDAVQARGVQVIVESHSEHLLRRLQRRLAEEHRGLRPADCALYFCRHQRTAAELVPLQIDRYGSITNWPDGFFGDDFGEVLAMQQAITRRQMAAAE
ncbi:MAG: DUF3696 domain-containing protein [Fimbriimonadaceae bacterium]|nr:DUF3696 domain-containing protein [Fimbriimonadaceae bacterium]